MNFSNFVDMGLTSRNLNKTNKAFWHFTFIRKDPITLQCLLILHSITYILYNTVCENTIFKNWCTENSNHEFWAFPKFRKDVPFISLILAYVLSYMQTKEIEYELTNKAYITPTVPFLGVPALPSTVDKPITNLLL